MSALARIRHRANDRGAVLIEFVLITPVLVLFVLGIFEYGNAYGNVASLERASQQGARAVSSMGDGRFADYEALRSIDAATRGLSGITLDKVVIFDATSIPDGSVPTACLSGSVNGSCNHYTGAQVRTTAPVGFTGVTSCSGSSWDRAWCPTDRPREHDNRVRIGVYIEVTYHHVTGLLPGNISMNQTAVYQIEPCAQGDTSC